MVFKEIELPSIHQSTIEKELPNLQIPYTERDEPNLEKLLIDIALPSSM
jgi:hypothetical protein